MYFTKSPLSVTTRIPNNQVSVEMGSIMAIARTLSLCGVNVMNDLNFLQCIVVLEGEVGQKKIPQEK